MKKIKEGKASARELFELCESEGINQAKSINRNSKILQKD